MVLPSIALAAFLGARSARFRNGRFDAAVAALVGEIRRNLVGETERGVHQELLDRKIATSSAQFWPVGHCGKRRVIQHWHFLLSSMSGALDDWNMGSRHCAIMDAQLTNGNPTGTERRSLRAASHGLEGNRISDQGPRHSIRAGL
jgi:hypothetical protein